MKRLFVVAILFVAVVATQAQVKEGVKYQIINKSGQFLDIYAGSKSDGTNVMLWDSNRSAGQQFTFVNASNGYWYILNVNSRKALNVAGTDTIKTNIEQYRINLAQSQRFKIIEADTSYVYIQTKGGNFLSSETLHGQKGSNVFLWSKNNLAMWEIVEFID